MTYPFCYYEIQRYTPANGINQAKTEEDFFYTDANGRFDFTTDVTGGLLVWPSYIDGSAYIGPPYFGNPVESSTDNSNLIYTSNYGTLYTTPYH